MLEVKIVPKTPGLDPMDVFEWSEDIFLATTDGAVRLKCVHAAKCEGVRTRYNYEGARIIGRLLVQEAEDGREEGQKP